MFLRPRLIDLKIIGFYTGKLILGIGFAMLLPLAISLFNREWGPVIDFVIGSSIAFSAGYLLSITCSNKKEMSWMHGILVVPVAWLAAMLFGAIPLYLSGHFLSFLDAMFDAMSGFTATGLTLIQDLDHLSYGHNFWRHLTMFIGGQGIVVVMLTLMTGGASGIYGMYVGEAREEKILPNLFQTTRFIVSVTLIYLGLGVTTLWLVGWQIGIPPLRSLFHAITIFVSGFNTGGFSPQSQSVIYYHSATYEFAMMPFMIAGAINFAVYYALFSGNRREIYKNAELLTMSAAICTTFAIAAVALSQIGIYNETFSVFRRGFYQQISALTSTGFTTVYSSQIPDLWGPLGLFGMMVAMGLGASIGSTAGGIKMHRLMIIFKAFSLEIKRMLLPPSSVIVEKYHHLKKNVITEKLLLNAFIIGFAYVASYIIAAIAGTFYGYSFIDSLFQSISAGANNGISSRIPLVDAPSALKIVYMIQMWAARLEFISIVALIGFIISSVRGK
ncbi:MAG: TrkH family potassium uptake protein [Actinobacteria bacterium]|nr:TrkH family potassium uptake protein [Actinomycetota bacterium]